MDLGFPIRHLQERLNEFRLDLHRLRLYRSKSWNYDVEHRIKEYGQAIDILNKANGVEQSDSNCNLDIVTHSTLDDEMVTILKPKYKAKDGTIKSALSITNLDTNTVKYLARKSDLYCG